MTEDPFDAEAAAPAWADTYRGVPRGRFLPRRIWPFDPATSTHSFVDRERDPAGWHAAAEANVPITTQWDDGRHEGDEPGALPSSSCSMPSVVLDMLGALNVQPGMRVLEIGTGTGWNAALLAHRLGEENVVTVEVDPDVAEQARARLKHAGLHPRVVTGDGAAGWAAGAPYDRVIATCGLRRVPWAWLEQTRPGGVVLAPWGTEYTQADALARLVVACDGVSASASGRFAGIVQFMKLRSQRLAWPQHEEFVTGEWPHGADISRTDLGREVIDHDPYDEAPFILGLAVRDCVHVAGEQGGERAAWFYSLSDHSWAAARFSPDEPGGEVYQHGPRRLWDEVEAAWHWWNDNGEPGINRFGLTVTPRGETAWLDEPGRPVGGGDDSGDSGT